MSGRRVAATRRRRHPFVRALLGTTASLLAVAVVLAVVVSVFVGGLARRYDAGRTVLADPFPTGGRPAPTDGAEDVLLIGSDSRERLDPDGDAAGGGRSDTLMLAHVPADRSGVYLVSVLRDSWVDVPGHGRAKVNAAYAWGGVPLTVQTVEQLLDVRIDHVAEIDFAGFVGMTDALGGVTVDAAQAFDTSGHHFVQGPNRLDGAAALRFVRERYSFPDADRTRVRNQQAFLRGVLQGVLSRGTLTDPGRIRAFVTATSEYLSVDEGLTFSRLAELGWSLRGIQPDDLHTTTLPTAGSGTSADGQSYVEVDTAALPALTTALRSDDLAPWFAQHADG
jgi:LCP family protein required for cell wall assembly